MRKIITIILFVFSLNTTFAQTINEVKDSVFKNIILINKADVTTDGIDFFIDLPISPQKTPLIIHNTDQRIPTKLFFDRNTFLPEQKELFLIQTDWEYEKEIREQEIRERIHIKAHRKKIYHIKRYYNHYKVDSAFLSMQTSTELHYKKPQLENYETKYDYIERYGSICCPSDSRHHFYDQLRINIKDFEERNNLLISNRIINTGKEGEKTIRYQLDNLTNMQKLQFIQLFKKADQINEKIYTPIIHPSKL